MNDKKIKVLIVEDTLVAQKLLKGLVLSDNRFELLGIVENGKQAVEFVKRAEPDVISMDILMPVMDGVEACRIIMQNNPFPIVIVSSFYQSSEIEMAIKVLEAGAVAIIPRPYGPGHSKFLQTSRQYLNTLKIMSEIKVVRRKFEKNINTQHTQKTAEQLNDYNSKNNSFKALAIGASAGGPEGIRTILSGLDSNFPLPVFVVQHIDNHFAEGFTTWLNTYSKIPVVNARDGEKILAGHVYLPPGDHHLKVSHNQTLSVTKDLPNKGLRPSVDTLFKSIAEVYGKNVIAVLLSGMGRDGAVGLKSLYDLGAFTIAQDEASCLVFGMPGEAVKQGAVCKLLSPENIIKEINRIINI